MSVWVDFLVQAAAGLVGVFAGVLLALLTERRRMAGEQGRTQAKLHDELAGVRGVVLASVVRNTSEAKKIRGILSDAGDQYLFRVNFELAVWEAAQSNYVRLAPLEERVVFTRFFDQVRRLDRLVDFCRQSRAESVPGSLKVDRESAELKEMEARLLDAAEDLRLAGVVLVTDFGEDMHKRLLGVAPKTPPA